MDSKTGECVAKGGCCVKKKRRPMQNAVDVEGMHAGVELMEGRQMDKKRERPQVALRVTPETAEQLRQRAKVERVTVSELVRRMIGEGLRR